MLKTWEYFRAGPVQLQGCQFLNGIYSWESSIILLNFSFTFLPIFLKKGGNRMLLPENVGFPIGSDGVQEYFVVEVHYDNPFVEKNIHYKAGINVYHTTNLRQHDAALLSLHHEANPTITIPPDVSDWIISTHCSSECTTKALSQVENFNGHSEKSVSIFNVLLHSHLSGRKLKLRHFRGDQELPWVANDENYDFNFQQNRPLRENVKLMAGDQLTLECTYDSTWASPHAVIGGISTEREMCDAFILYYPAIKDFGLCTSTIEFPRVYTKFGITNVTRANPQSPYKITAPPQFANVWYHDFLEWNVSWTPELLKELQDELQFSSHTSRCSSDWSIGGSVSYPEVSHIFQPEKQRCPVPVRSGSGAQTSSLTFLWLIVVAVKINLF